MCVCVSVCLSIHPTLLELDRVSAIVFTHSMFIFVVLPRIILVCLSKENYAVKKFFVNREVSFAYEMPNMETELRQLF